MSREDDIKQLMVENNHRLQLLKEKEAVYGISVDPSVLIEIKKIEIALVELKVELDNLDKIPRINPYRGLSAFDETDAKFFFGREEATNQLVEAVRQKPIVALIGPSGSGKSSVIFAGLLPRLKRDYTNGKGWGVVRLRPGVQPFSSLAEALIPLLEPEKSEMDRIEERHKLENALKESRVTLHEIITPILQKNIETNRLLLIVDQFEELYTLCPDIELRQSFQDTLLTGIEANRARKGPSLTVLLSLRADFMGSALTHRAFADALQNADIKLGPMSREELRDAIEKPAEQQGLFFESGLVDTILKEVGDEAGKLPFLEFALTSLWERQTKRTLTHTAYETIGRVDGALANYAQEMYTKLDQAEQKVVQRVLLQMVQPGEITDTRRLASRTELGDRNWDVARRLADARLVVTNVDSHGHETAEVAHEALIRGWQQLRKWVDDDREFRTWQEQLRAALRQWEVSQQDEGALLRGAPLAQAEDWLNRREVDLSQDAQAFIRTSIALRDRERIEREQRRRRTVLGLSAALVGAVLGLCIMFLLAGGASWGWWETTQQKEIAFTRQLRSQAMGLAETQLDLALLLNVEASQRIEQQSSNPLRTIFPQEDVFETQSILLNGLASNPFLDTYLRGHTGRVTAVAFSKKGLVASGGGDDNSIILWDVDNKEPHEPPRILAGHTGGIYSLTFNPEGDTLASGSADGTVILWDVEDGKPRGKPLDKHNNEVTSVAFSPDGEVLAVGSCGKIEKTEAGETCTGEIWLWNPNKREPLRDEPITGRSGYVWSLAFGADWLLASGGADGTIMLWNLEEDASPYNDPLVGHASGVTSLAFHPKIPGILASGSQDKTVIIWNLRLADNPKVAQLSGHENTIISIAFSPDGQFLASTGWDKKINLWQMSTFSLLGSLTSHTEKVNSLAFIPDERAFTLASGSDDGSVILWNVNGHRLGSTLTENSSQVLGVALSPAGTILASSGDDDRVILWNLATHVPLFTLPPAQSDVLDVAFSGDASDETWGLATSQADGTIKLWRVRADGSGYELKKTLPEDGGGNEDNDESKTTALIRSVAFTSNGDMFALGNDQGEISLWDLKKEELIRDAPKGHSASVNALAFSSDDILASGSCGKLEDEECKQGEIRLWDLNDEKSLGSPLEGHEDAISSLVFNPDGDRLASGSRDGSIILWNVADKDSVKTLDGPLNGHTGAVTSLIFSPDANTLVSGGEDNTIIFWNVSGSAVQRDGVSLTGHKGKVTSLAFAEGGTILVSGGADGKIILWDVKNRQQLDKPLAGHTAEIRSLAYNPDNKEELAAGTTQNVVNLWDTKNKEVKETLIGHESWVNSLAFSDDGRQLATASSDKTVILWDVVGDSPEEIENLEGHTDQVMSVAFNGERNQLASGGLDGKVILWNLEEGSPEPHELNGHGDSDVRKVAFSPDGQWLASGDREGLIILWNMENLEDKYPLEGHSSQIESLTFSPDNQILASGSSDTDIILWDVATKNIKSKLSGHSSYVGSLTFSPGGKILASGSGDETIILWDVDKRQPLGPPLRGLGAGFGGAIHALAFHPDGEKLASGSSNGAIIEWNLDFGTWAEQACLTTARNLTWEEWGQIFGNNETYRSTCPETELYLGQKVVQARTLAQAGDDNKARNVFVEVVELATEIESAEFNNYVCRVGSLNGFADIVMTACDRAVELASTNEDQAGLYLDSRGFAEAKMRNYDDARKDFDEFSDWAKENPEDVPGSYRSEVAHWINVLSDDESPFEDEEVLNFLQNEWQFD